MADGLLAGRLRIDGHGTCVRTHTGYAIGVVCGFFVLDILIRIFHAPWMGTSDIPCKFANLREILFLNYWWVSSKPFGIPFRLPVPL